MLNSLTQLFSKARKHQGFRRYFANTSWMFAEQILRMIAGLLVGIWVARYLGPEQLGLYSYAAVFVAMFSPLAKLGLDEIVVRNIVRSRSAEDAYLGTAFWLKIAGALAAMAASAGAILLLSNRDDEALYVFIISAGLIFQSFEVVDFRFQSLVLSKYVSVSRLIQLAVSSLLKIYLVLIKAELIWFVLVILIDQITLAVALFLVCQYEKASSFYRHFDSRLARKLLADSWPLMFSGLVVMLYMRIDQILIRQMLGVRELGIYSVAVRLSEVWYFLPLVIASSILPALVNAKQADRELYFARLQKLYALMIWLAIGVALPMTFFGEWLVTVLYGEQYKEAGKVLAIHAWAGVFVFLGVAFNKHLVIENLSRKLLQRALLGAVVNVIALWVLVPRYGIYGAAWAVLISQAVVNYAGDLLDKSMHHQLRLKTNAFLKPWTNWRLH